MRPTFPFTPGSRWELGCCQPPPPPPPWMDAFATPPKIMTWSCSKKAPAIFSLLRVILCVFSFGILIWQASAHGGTASGDNRTVYAANWSLVWQVIYLFFAALTTMLAVAKRQPCSCCVTTPWYAHVAWLMHMTAVVIPVLVALSYWIFVYDDCDNIDGSATPGDPSDDCSPDEASNGSLNLHGINAAVAVLDWMWHEHWYPPWDISIPICFGSLYLCVSFLHYKQTDVIIYEWLDWSDGSSATALGLAICLFVIPAAYSIFAWLDFLFKQRKLFKMIAWTLGCLRRCVVCCWCKPCCSPPPKSPPDAEAPPIDVACQTDSGSQIGPAPASSNKRTTSRSSFRRILSEDDAIAAVAAASRRPRAEQSPSRHHSSRTLSEMAPLNSTCF